MLAPRVSRAHSANVRRASAAPRATDAQGLEDATDGERETLAPTSSIQPAGSTGANATDEDAPPADETERTRLIADIARLIRQPTVPEGPRLAGLTLIGWLARRRPEETPHCIGVAEAQTSERRLPAARAKPR